MTVEVIAEVSIWHASAEGMELSPNERAPNLLRLFVCKDVRFVLDCDAPDTAGQIAAMRKLAALATEAAEKLEARAAESVQGQAGDVRDPR